MSSIAIGFLGIFLLFVLLALRLPIGIALASVSIGGIWMTRGPNAALGTLKSIPYDFAAHWTLSAVPMFLLMGAITSHSGMTQGLYKAMRVWLGGLPGGLAVATNFAGAGFAAASGSSLATTATLGRVAVPEMLRYGYHPGLATGVAAAVGTLGAVIPPSILIVLYAMFAQVSVGKALIAGIIPGLLTAVVYAAMIIIRCKLNPSIAPHVDEGHLTLRDKLALIWPIWPLPLLVIGVIGGIYSGITTATEAGALGVILAGVIAALQGNLNFATFRAAVSEAALTTATILFIAVGAVLFTRFLAFTGVASQMSAWVAAGDGNVLVIMLVVCAVYLVLGCFLDPLGVMLLTLPVMLPVFDGAGVNLIWAGIVLVKMMEIGMLTPPVGMNIFVMKGVVGDAVPLNVIFRGVLWFLLAEVFVMAILIGFPQVTLFLPDLMN